LSKAIQKRVNSLWMLSGEILRNLKEKPHMRRVPDERHLFDLIEAAARFSMTATRRISKDLLIAPAVSRGGSLPNRLAEACSCWIKPEFQNHVHLLSFPQPS
jgi:hypothetical protein